MAKLRGTNKSETLDGLTEHGDIITSFGGSDIINARGGGDVISAGDGADTVSGGRGDDVIYGHSKAALSPKSSFIDVKEIVDIGPGAVQTARTDADPGFFYALSKDEGIIYRINEKTGNSKEFLDIPNSQFAHGGEQGVLGMAFHPDYEHNGRIFAYLTNPNGDIEVQEYGPESANSSQMEFKQTIITIAHPDFNYHNGGSIEFGPDDMLYLGVGDGGPQGDPNGNAQNLDSLLGKILRIDVDHDSFPGDLTKNYGIPDDNPYAISGGAAEVWASGVRNPWRLCFDPATGDLYIGDVGQDEWEEINYVAADTPGGLNFGWNYFEGDESYDGTPPDGVTFTDPVFSYPHAGVNSSVTGGVVYHGPTPGLTGAYIFADFVTNKIYSLRVVDGVAEDAFERTEQIQSADISNIASFGTDSNGNLLAVSLSGKIYRITPGLAAGDSDDELHGGGGKDRLYGGFGNDSLFGDNNDDRLSGGVGDDSLEGGNGADRFMFNTSSGHDVVTDFHVSGHDHDVLDLGNVRDIDNFHDLQRNHISMDGEDVIIEAGNISIRLEDVSSSELARRHFDFA